MDDLPEKIMCLLFCALFLAFTIFITVGIYYTIKEESIRIEQLEKKPEKALYKNINFELKGENNENL